LSLFFCPAVIEQEHFSLFSRTTSKERSRVAHSFGLSRNLVEAISCSKMLQGAYSNHVAALIAQMRSSQLVGREVS
jgi:hypothetical protein